MNCDTTLDNINKVCATLLMFAHSITLFIYIWIDNEFGKITIITWFCKTYIKCNGWKIK